MTPSGDSEPPAREAMGGSGEVQVVASPRFKLVFLGVLGLTVLGLVGELALAVISGPNHHEVRFALGTCDWVVKAGLGCLIGLLAGKATR